MAACPSCGRESPVGSPVCSRCGTPLDDLDRTHVRKTATILFCDLVGSTELAERLDPESMRLLMSRYFAVMRAVIERHGGMVEKFIGDAVMAVFGVPVVHEDDALRGVRAAAEMRSALASLNLELARDRGVTIGCRIGVNSGEVVAGGLAVEVPATGDPGTAQALVTGDAVNVAARLEQAAAPGQVLLGAQTLRLAGDAVTAEPVAPLSLKGKAEPVPACRRGRRAACRAGSRRSSVAPRSSARSGRRSTGPSEAIGASVSRSSARRGSASRAWPTRSSPRWARGPRSDRDDVSPTATASRTGP
jgi:class 3 adenylate cyclase